MSFSVVFLLVKNMVFSPMRILFGTAAVFFLPGYTLLLAICPRKKQLAAMERLVLSFGLSMAIVPLLLYPLNFTSWGIQSWSVILTLLCFIITMFVITVYRQRRMPREERASLDISFSSPKWDQILSLNKVFVFFSIITTIFLLALLAGVYATSQGGRFTEFYVLGPDGTTESLPATVIEGESMDLIVGVGNYEEETLVYSIHINIDGKNAMIVKALQIAPGQNWEKSLRVPVSTTPGKRVVELHLMREGMERTYKDLFFWMDVKQ